MPKANMTLPDGTVVTIDGSIEEIQKILLLHRPEEKQHLRTKQKHIHTKSVQVEKDEIVNDVATLSDIVNTIKNCDEADKIESNVLDRTSQVDRTLLPFYISHKYFHDKIRLTTGEVAKILSDLNINIRQPNVAKTISTTAAKYVIGDKMKKKGQAVRYKLSRRGIQYFEALLKAKTDE
jgi:hypothetical protein